MNREYATYQKMKKQEHAPTHGGRGNDDLDRVILFIILGLAAVVGYFVTAHSNKPENVLNSSISKTLKIPFRASIEGKTVLQDSVISAYRNRETFSPEKGMAAKTLPGANSTPLSAFEALNMIRNTTHAEELDREDMYGRPTRHFYGEVNGERVIPGMPEGYYFEYWADMRNLSAVRLMLTGVCRNAAVNAKGDSLSRETTLNIRFY